MNKLYLLFIVIASVLFSACGNSTDVSSDSLTQEQENETTQLKPHEILTSKYFKAQLSSDFIHHSPSNIKKSYSDIGDITEILAFAIDEYGDVNLELTKSVTIENNGSFSIEFNENDDNETDWIMIMSNPDANDIEEKVGNFISLSENDIGLTTIPMGQATKDIDAGILTKTYDETISTNSISDVSDSFNIPKDTLIGIAKFDDTQKMVKNLYLNTDLNTNIYYKPFITFSFENKLLFNDFIEADSNEYLGYKINIYTNDIQSNDYIDICTGIKEIEFVPPSDVIMSISNNIVTQESSFSFLNAEFIGNYSCYNDDFSMTDQSYFDNSESLTFGTREIIGNIPSGYWKFKKDNIETAAFDLEVGSVFDKDNKYKFLMPVINLITDDNNKVIKIEIEWFKYDKELDKYVQELDADLIKKFINNINIGFTYVGDINDHVYENFSITDLDINTVISDFNHDWYTEEQTNSSKIVVEIASVVVWIGKNTLLSFRYYINGGAKNSIFK